MFPDTDEMDNKDCLLGGCSLMENIDKQVIRIHDLQVKRGYRRGCVSVSEGH